MRHKALLVLGLVLLAQVMACGGGPSEADIEATVEARLTEERATEATVEAKAQAMAKAMVEATAQALPTATPIPPTPTPTPTPPSSIAILTNAKKAMTELESFHYNVDISFKTAGMVIPIKVAGDFQAPDRVKETMSIAILGMQLETKYIKVGNQTYAKEPMSEWTATDEFEGFDIKEMWSGDDDNLLDIPIAAEPALEEFDGITLYHMKWDLPEGSKELTAFLNVFGDSDDEDIPENLKIEFWIDVGSYYLKKFVLGVDIPIDEEGEDSFFSGLGADVSGTASLAVEVTLSAFNEDLKPIVAPR